MEQMGKYPFLSDLAETDWDFAGHDTSDVASRFHWHPARFPAQLPAIFISGLSTAGETLLDPFCGSGTALVEAVKQKRNAFGIDTNPVSILICAGKLNSFDPLSFHSYSAEIVGDATRALALQGYDDSQLVTTIPNYVEQSRWYHPTTLAELGALWSKIMTVENPHRAMAVASFSSILKQVCSQDKHWGWICDNVAPGQLRYVNAVREFKSKMDQMAIAASQIGRDDHKGLTVTINEGQAASVLASVPAEAFDLVVTSPPYFGVTDYAKAQRLTFLWLDESIEHARVQESGARSKRRRKTALQEYLDEMTLSFMQISRVLRPGRHCVVVLGESPTREPYLSEFERLVGLCGMSLVERVERRLPRQRGMIATLQSERILVFERD